jgi:Domain of unknown function (DUF362)/Carbohydrate binding module (family 6)
MSDPVRTCPRTGRPVPQAPKGARWLLPALGLASVVWFLVRVIPKPSRATYPCQRAAAPLATAFVTWLAGLAVPAVLLRKARGLAAAGRAPFGWLAAAVAFAVAGAWTLAGSPSLLRTHAASETPYALLDGPLQPVGVARGVAPGRVVWVHDPKAVAWELQGSWWEDQYNDQAVIDEMLSRAVQWVSNEKSDAKAWDALFRYFNKTHARGDVGYQAGERIAIKVNLNNTTGHDTIPRLNTSPQLTLSLVKELVTAAGVKPSDITILDPSRFVPQNLYDKVHGSYPDVAFVDHIGGDGRVKATFRMGAIPFSEPSRNASGVATAALEATYLIDASVLKGHVSSGVTLSAKNLFGLTSIDPDWRKNDHHGFAPKRDGTPSYSAFVDFLGHKDMGGKTMLFLMDGLYANDLVDDPPHLKWKMAPFDGQWPSSLFASQDGVALDSVSLDLLRSEWPNLADLSYCDDYMREAALAGDPPSKAFYDPEGDGTRLTSLGVHEHWNDAVHKQYSRNLGKNVGIELYTGPAPVVPRAAEAKARPSFVPKGYTGKPFGDDRHPAEPQRIPGRLECELYDRGGPEVAYHDSDAKNSGSGGLNRIDGSYLNGFRADDAVDISYTKDKGDPPPDFNPFNRVTPEPGSLYVGWTEAGEWVNYTVTVEETGIYSIDVLYTSNGEGRFELSVDGTPRGTVTLPTTHDDADPVAWRQWHHWNRLETALDLDLKAGVHLVRIAFRGGNTNLDYLEFRRK